MPLCLQCNRTFKRGGDPISGEHKVDDKEAYEPLPLVESFHPYGRPAIDHVTVQVSRNEVGKKTVSIEEAGAKNPSNAVQRLNKLLKLEERWSGRLHRYVIGAVQELLLTMMRSCAKRGYFVDERDLEEHIDSTLKELAQQYSESIGKQPYRVLCDSYLNYTLSDVEELNDYVQWLKQNLADVAGGAR